MTSSSIVDMYMINSMLAFSPSFSTNSALALVQAAFKKVVSHIDVLINNKTKGRNLKCQREVSHS